MTSGDDIVALDELAGIFEDISGVRVSGRRAMVRSRLEGRARALGLASFKDYLDYYHHNREAETQTLVSLLATHTTSFFRHQDLFDYLFDHVFPKLKRGSDPVWIWSAATATGQEAYSIAMAAVEYFGADPPVRILGTDVDSVSLEQAANGIYKMESLRSLRPKLIDRYFVKGTGELSGHVKVADSIWGLCEFRTLNLIKDSPQSQEFEAIFLCNVLFYFDIPTIQKVIWTVSRRLNPGGALLLGPSETLNEIKTPLVKVQNSIHVLPSLGPSSASRQSSAPVVERKIRTLIVDDSPSICRLLVQILSKDPEFQIAGVASSASEAAEYLQQGNIDVMTLDIHMPGTDGITFLKNLHAAGSHPPTVILSSASYEDAVEVFKCFEVGAFDFLVKPAHSELPVQAERIRTVLKLAAHSRRSLPEPAADFSAGPLTYSPSGAKDLILLGGSTGGNSAIKKILSRFPLNSPPVLIVQHIPPVFSKAFAHSLASTSRIGVKEAVDHEPLLPGMAYVAPGGKQFEARKGQSGLEALISDANPTVLHKPSVDYLFRSVAPLASEFRVVAALLTGMGTDGADGLKMLRDAGAHTIAQDRDSCVVFGMPRAAIERGAAVEIVPLLEIGNALFKRFSNAKAA